MLSPLPFTIIKHNELNIFSIAIQYITLSKGKLVISKAIYKVIIYKAHIVKLLTNGTVSLMNFYINNNNITPTQ